MSRFMNREAARRAFHTKRAELMVMLQFQRITWAEYRRRMAELGKTAKMEAVKVDAPACPRCGAELTAIVCPPGMSVAKFSYRRDGDWTCLPCSEAKQMGKLHPKAKVSWFASRFGPPATPSHLGGRS